MRLFTPLLAFAVLGIAAGVVFFTLDFWPSQSDAPTPGTAARSVPANRPGPQETYDGYTLLAPTGQGRIYWVDMEGEVAKTLETGFGILHAEQLANGNILTLATLNGFPRLIEFTGEGNVVWEWMPDSGLIHHDFVRTVRNTTLTILRFRQGAVRHDEIVEVDRGGAIVWRWNSLDHLDRLADRGPAEHGSDWLHTNSVSLFSDGDLLVSLRNLNRLVRIDYPSGEIVWSWGEEVLGHQHAAEVLPDGNILVFDNGVYRTSELCDDDSCSSRALEIDPATGEVVWLFEGDGLLSIGFGDVDRLPNGNTLITFGWIARILEVTPAGRVVWDFQSEIEGYVPFFEPDPLRPSLYRAQRVAELP